jgi:AraC-like DNA-binding protein
MFVYWNSRDYMSGSTSQLRCPEPRVALAAVTKPRMKVGDRRAVLWRARFGGMPAAEPWRGALRVRPGVVAFDGQIGSAEPHAHAAVQLYACSRGAIEVTDGSGTSITARRLVIPARARHQVRATSGVVGTTTFVDPSSTWAPPRGSWESSVEHWADEERGAYLSSALRGISTPATATFGARVEEWVRARLPDRAQVADLAGSLAMSESTLRRRARADLGLSVQAYARWVRLLVALEQVAAGGTIADAAAAAGFADGSHATRACREMFGLTPSEAIAHLTFQA